MLLGLHGLAGSGKDASLAIIRELLPDTNVVRDGFADRLKLSAARIFYPEIELEEAVAWCNGLKGDGESIARTTTTLPFLGIPLSEAKETMTGRVFMQRYGTESHRDVFGEDFWTTQVLPVTTNDSYGRPDVTEGDLLVITDARFINEAQRIRMCDGQIWRIDRPSVASSDAHVSEVPLPAEYIDRTIDNSRSLGHLRLELSRALHQQFGL